MPDSPHDPLLVTVAPDPGHTLKMCREAFTDLPGVRIAVHPVWLADLKDSYVVTAREDDLEVLVPIGPVEYPQELAARARPAEGVARRLRDMWNINVAYRAAILSGDVAEAERVASYAPRLPDDYRPARP